ncbi:MAG TPA: hypothetical protein VFX51_14590 [Solirubrobacteraceae bacterium]|nr:hypothetical protein [Solirubrobacteraceae bacterium]
MLGRRFLLLVAVLMGLTALAASLAPREPLIRNGDRRTATATPSPTPAPVMAEALKPVERTIFTAENPTRVVVRKGQTLELTVRGSDVDSVMLLDEIEPIEENSPALFEILADTPGEYPIELVDADRQIGTLVVR